VAAVVEAEAAPEGEAAVEGAVAVERALAVEQAVAPVKSPRRRHAKDHGWHASRLSRQFDRTRRAGTADSGRQRPWRSRLRLAGVRGRCVY
jgi:hypothetical protein